MPRGYLEGPASEERAEALDRGPQAATAVRPRIRRAVYGSTPDRPQRHFIGWADEIDREQLFAAGKAWGLSVVLREE